MAKKPPIKRVLLEELLEIPGAENALDSQVLGNMNLDDGCLSWQGSTQTQTGMPILYFRYQNVYCLVSVRKYRAQLFAPNVKQLSKPTCGNKRCLQMAHYTYRGKKVSALDE